MHSLAVLERLQLKSTLPPFRVCSPRRAAAQPLQRVYTQEKVEDVASCWSAQGSDSPADCHLCLCIPADCLASFALSTASEIREPCVRVGASLSPSECRAWCMTCGRNSTHSLKINDRSPLQVWSLNQRLPRPLGACQPCGSSGPAPDRHRRRCNEIPGWFTCALEFEERWPGS